VFIGACVVLTIAFMVGQHIAAAIIWLFTGK
jgi:hypothetical protein